MSQAKNEGAKGSTDAPAGFVIAALRGGSGKTIASLGIARALSKAGKRVACFKKGPDYIDAAWLAHASGSPCYNLDPFMMELEVIKESFWIRTSRADVAIIEGNRGLFDGMDPEGSSSTASLARNLGLPVVLVVDCTKATRTIAALISGCLNFEEDLNIAGVILNNIGGPRHKKIISQSINKYLDIPIFGHIPRLKRDPLPMRHLGLTPAFEFQGANEALDKLAELISKNIDLDAILKVAPHKGPPPDSKLSVDSLYGSIKMDCSGLKIGILKDAAFQFYYPENLEALRYSRAQLVEINALDHDTLPDVDGLYIGGGFPETQAESLEKNKGLRSSIRQAAEAGLPIYAECGGLMYLGEGFNWQGTDYNMVGALPFTFTLSRRPIGHGYTILQAEKPNPIYPEGGQIRGHEFHYSKPTRCDSHGYFSCHIVRGYGFDGENEGFVYKNVFATYSHVHALGQRNWASGFLGFIKGPGGGNHSFHRQGNR